jgi:uncharacterized protein involved in exopolysaccharide biosynthesis
MAERKQDLLGMLADRGEDVVGRISELPRAQRLLETANQLRDRADELQRKLRGLDALEQRVAVLEKKVEQLSGGSASGTAKRTAKRPTAKRTTTAKKPPPKSPPPKQP